MPSPIAGMSLPSGNCVPPQSSFNQRTAADKLGLAAKIPKLNATHQVNRSCCKKPQGVVKQ